MTAVPPTRLPSEDAIADAGKLIREGRLVAFPTETVYGLGADTTNDTAVARIFEAKGRPSFNPLICHVRDLQAARELGRFSPQAQSLAERFWPGALTLVVPRSEGCRASLLVSAGLDTIALRAPAHPVAQALIAAADRPIAAPSANRSGEVSPTTAVHVLESLDDRVSLILDGGPCQLGLELTVVGYDQNTALLLRPGAIERKEIEAITGPLGTVREDADKPASPGRLLRHYAPRTLLRLNATSAHSGEALLAFGAPPPGKFKQVMNLSPVGDLLEAAGHLFAYLRALDRSGAATIAVMPIPDQGLGEAINDRLRRAAAGSGQGS